MCGITGIWNFNREEHVRRDTLEYMTNVLGHRGPDNQQIQMIDNVGLGFRRLSIIDLIGSVQPMSNEDEQIWLVFNGEIYNYQAIRPDLVSVGHQFKTNGDTEVIIHSYEQYGLDCFNKFRGMFALAIYDRHKDHIVLAVDSFGEKPLYYTLDGKQLNFASEIKALLQHPNVSRDLDLEALDEYFTYGTIGAPRSIFKSIRKVPPGSYILINRNGGNIQHQYWSPTYASLDQVDKRPFPELVQELEQLLFQSVKRQMIADVPLGALLSGGIDSSTVVAIMAQLSSTPIKTFSIGFKEAQYNEAPYAQKLANHLGTEHHVEILEPNALEILPDIIYYYDEPFADSSAIPTYYVAKLARNHVTVALSGDGGDEVFGGYYTYKKSYQLRRLHEMLPGIYPTLQMINRITPQSTTGSAVRERFNTLFNSNGYYYPVTRPTFFDRNQRHALFKQRSNLFLQAEKYKLLRVNENPRSGWLNRLLYTDTSYYLPSDLLPKVDRASMIHSLEIRIPLLDRDIFEFMSRIPQEYKFNGKDTKVILKHIIAPKLPQGFLDRPKQGFAVPIAEWMRTSLKPMIEDVLFNKRTSERGIFDMKFVRQIYDWHQTGRNFKSTNCLWSAFIFELWAQKYLDNSLLPTTTLR